MTQPCSERLWDVTDTVSPPFTPLLNVPRSRRIRITGLAESDISTFTKTDFVLPHCYELVWVVRSSGVPFSLPAVPGPVHPPGAVHNACHGCKNKTKRWLVRQPAFALSRSLSPVLSVCRSEWRDGGSWQLPWHVGSGSCLPIL